MTLGTLREVYDRYYDKEDLRPATLAKMKHHISRWEKFTCNPPVEAISNEVVKSFRTQCLAAGLQPTSINGCWQDLRAVLRKVGMQEHKNPGALGLLKTPIPWMKPVPVPRKRPRRIPLDDITKIYVACGAATQPSSHVPAADWWRALIVVALTVGLRRADLFALTFSQIDLDAGEISWTSEKTGASDIFCLHPVACEHLLRIVTPRERVFAGIYKNGGRFYKLFHAIQARVGIERPIGLHDLRRTGASEIERVAPGLGRLFLQHAGRTVTDRSYVNSDEELREAIEKMRLPDGFRSGPRMRDRACEQHQQQQAQIHAADFYIPTGPALADWTFTETAFAHRGRWHRLGGKRLELLKVLATTPRPVTCAVLSAALQLPEHRTQIEVSQVRNTLRRAFGLVDGFNPVPNVARGSGGTWTLQIPPYVNREPIKKRRLRRRKAQRLPEVNPSDFEFSVGMVFYKGTPVAARGQVFKALKLLASGEPVSAEALMLHAGCSKPHCVLDKVRTVLRRTLNLGTFNPVQNVERSVWVLILPA